MAKPFVRQARSENACPDDLTIRFLLLAALFLAAAAIATLLRYESLDPCVWMERDLVEDSGLPPAVVRARIAAGFLLEGITDPSPVDCLLEWWRLRREGVPEQP